ncbi:hypothetical protein JXB27_00655 [Candidatus Woesearchaeota archaeon]|nr:hypothetical protein [Candidatus Woesearchaeota archaeon]
MGIFTNEYGDFSWKRTLITVGILAAISTKGCVALDNKVTGENVCQGQVTSFGRTGLIWPTYEGTFAIGGENRSESGFFSLDEKARHGENLQELAAQLTKAVETRSNVRVYERTVAWPLPWNSKQFSRLYKVEVIDAQTPTPIPTK